MKLISKAFGPDQFIPLKYSGYGEDISPELTISEIPHAAKSLVLIMEDPDSPGQVWQHWLMWNISPSTSEISENKVPDSAIEGLNDFGRVGYGGPKPNAGIHHYHFKLLALSIIINLPEGSKKSDIDEAIKDSVIDYTELIALYSAPSGV